MAKGSKRRSQPLTTAQLVIFSMLGAVMFCTKVIMEFLPNIHLLGMLTMVYTIVYRKKALVPIYIYVVLNGIYAGFDMWWIPYLYIWTILWAVTMALPKGLKPRYARVIYPVICSLHGLLFGTLYAPAWAVMMKLNFRQTIAWIISGLTFDGIHALGNLAAGMLIFPLSELLKKLTDKPAFTGD